MKKPTVEAVAATENAATDETATATEGNRNLVPPRHSLLPSLPLFATLLFAPQKSPPWSPRAKENEDEKMDFGMWGAPDKKNSAAVSEPKYTAAVTNSMQVEFLQTH
jgi:hypothetical protein